MRSVAGYERTGGLREGRSLLDTPDISISAGCNVTLHFSIVLEDGTLAESTRGDEPIRFTVGDGTLANGLELALYGLKAGARQRLQIGPRDAFGYPEPDRVHSLPRSEFPTDMQLEPGMIVAFTTPAGDEVPGGILEIRHDDVLVDFNHPLAGHEIVFDVEVLEVHPPSPDPAGSSDNH